MNKVMSVQRSTLIFRIFWQICPYLANGALPFILVYCLLVYYCRYFMYCEDRDEIGERGERRKMQKRRMRAGRGEKR